MTGRPKRDGALLALVWLLGLLAVCTGAATAVDLVNVTTGRPGTLTVTGCAQDYGSRKPRYNCIGTFDSSDGTVHRPDVAFDESFRQEAGDRLPATLNGGTVNEVSYASTVTGSLVAVASLAGVITLIVLRRRLRRAERARKF